MKQNNFYNYELLLNFGERNQKKNNSELQEAKSKSWYLRSSILVTLLVILCDQSTKIVALRYLETLPNHCLTVNQFFNLSLVFNHGVSFGMFQANDQLRYWIILIFTLTLLIILITWWINAKSKLEKIACSLVVGGALGNLIDRIRLQSVVDFLDFHLLQHHWPTFNVADGAIVIGVFILLWRQLKNS